MIVISILNAAFVGAVNVRQTIPLGTLKRFSKHFSTYITVIYTICAECAQHLKDPLLLFLEMFLYSLMNIIFVQRCAHTLTINCIKACLLSVSGVETKSMILMRSHHREREL